MGPDSDDAELRRLRDRIASLERQLADVNSEQEELRDREALYRRLVELAPDAMLVHGPNRRIVYANPASARLFGAAKADDLMGLVATDLIHPDGQESAEPEISRLLAGEIPFAAATEKHLVRPDGTDFYGDVTASAIEWDDAHAALVLVRDATARRQGRAKYEEAEAGRREAHLRLIDAIDAMSEGFALFDAEDRLQIYNQHYVHGISGLCADIIKPGIRFEDIIEEAVKRGLWRGREAEQDTLVASVYDRHRNLPSESEVLYPSGRWIRQTKKRTRDGGVVAVYADITSLKEREQALRESEERHRHLLETLPDAVVISVDEKVVFVNAAAVRLLGARDRDELVGMDAYALVPPHLVEMQRERRRKVMAERCILPPVDQQRRRLDGALVDVETVATFITWEGKPAFLGVLRDITARKQAEVALAETERRFSAATDNLPGAVFQRVMTPDGKLSLSYVSAGVTELTGLTPQQIVRDVKPFFDLIRDDFKDEFMAHLKQSAERMEPVLMEVPMIGPGGKPLWVQSKGRPRRRADGAIVWDGILMDITEQKLAQESARRSYRWLLEAIASMSSGFMLWDPEDRLILWNDRMASYHPQPDIFREGLTFEELIDGPYRDIKRRLGESAAEEWLAERRRQHREATGYHEFQGTGGRWFVLTARRTPEGFNVTMLTDVTERHDSEEQLRASEERYKTLVNLSPDAVYVHRGGHIIVCNEAAVSLFRASSPEDLIGRHSLDLVHPEFRDQIRRLQQTSARAGTRMASGRQKRLRCDGSWFWAEVSAGAIDWDGERSGIVVVRDATEQIAAEEVLRRSKEEAELANRSKTEFLANISHELRTPLNAIIGFSDLMQREMLGPLGNEKYRAYLRDIYQSGNHLHDVINDILDLSKIEAGQLELREETVNIRTAIDRCIRVVAARAEEGGLELIPRIADGLPHIRADERKVKQILINLLSNAVKFTDKGGSITIDAFPADDGGVVMRVSDTGIGMKADEIPRALTPFMQVDSTLSRRHEGTGLGLPLTKSLAELHGGSLTLESAPGQGTTVTVILPAARTAIAPTAAA